MAGEGGEGPELMPQQELPKKTPTEASVGFLKKWRERLVSDRIGTLEFVLRGTGSILLAKDAASNFMQGNYLAAAAEGLVAGISAIAPIRTFNRGLK